MKDYWRPSFGKSYKNDIEDFLQKHPEIPFSDVKRFIEFCATDFIVKYEYGNQKEINQNTDYSSQVDDLPDVVEAESQKELPTTPGIYVFKKNSEIVYIGQSSNIKRRCSQHALTNSNEFDIFYKEVEEENKRKEIESQFIRSKNPEFNGNEPYSNNLGVLE